LALSSFDLNRISSQFLPSLISDSNLALTSFNSVFTLLEEGVVAAGSDGTEEHEQEVVVVVLVEDEGGAEGDEGGDEDGEGEF